MENELTDKTGKHKKWISVLIGLTICAAFFLACAGIFFPIQTLFYLTVGWILFLRQVIPQMMVSTSGLLTALSLLVLMGVVIQLLGRYVTRLLSQKDEILTQIQWQFRWTCAVLLLVVISFTGGFAVVGVAHQSVGLATGKKRVLQTSYGRGDLSRSLSSLNNVRNIGLAVVNYSSGFENPLPTDVINSTGQPLHSWETQLLPFLDSLPLYQKIDLTQPWNSTTNSEVFKNSISVFKMPASGLSSKNEDGYGLSYYSLNKHVFYPASGIKLDQIRDGAANTIMIGEVISRVPAWG